METANIGGGVINLKKNELGAAFYIQGDYRRMYLDIEYGKIYNAILTYDGKKECLYINGEKKAEFILKGKISPPELEIIMAIGANPKGKDNQGGFFNGKIYSAAVYNRALTESEVQKNADMALTFAYGN